MRLTGMLLALALLPLAGCPARTIPTIPATPPGGFPILSAVPTTATETLMKIEKREDIEIRPTNFEMVPAVVAKGESPVFVLGPRSRASFAGDEAGTAPWKVDNVILVEVLDEAGKIIDTFVTGFLTGRMYQGNEMLENLGEWSPNFEARTPDLSLRLPREQRLKLQVTALDNGNAGSVTDLFLIIEEVEEAKDELRDEFWEGKER
ncbi:MAG: hypothetical protein P1V51_08030 [Deltaproteobacteria bacterium]|nr:hypothetical protein [Deltaproteobacteria bacterium]